MALSRRLAVRRSHAQRRRGRSGLFGTAGADTTVDVDVPFIEPYERCGQVARMTIGITRRCWRRGKAR